MTTLEAKKQYLDAIESSGLTQKEWYWKVYLKSDHWKELRERAFALHGRYCAKCSATKRLDVHHITYRWIFDVTPEHLQILCRPCHQQEHPEKQVVKPKKILPHPKKSAKKSASPKSKHWHWEASLALMMKSAKRKDDHMLESKCLKRLIRRFKDRLSSEEVSMLQRRRNALRKAERKRKAMEAEHKKRRILLRC